MKVPAGLGVVGTHCQVAGAAWTRRDRVAVPDSVSCVAPCLLLHMQVQDSRIRLGQSARSSPRFGSQPQHHYRQHASGGQGLAMASFLDHQPSSTTHTTTTTSAPTVSSPSASAAGGSGRDWPLERVEEVEEGGSSGEELKMDEGCVKGGHEEKFEPDV